MVVTLETRQDLHANNASFTDVGRDNWNNRQSINLYNLLDPAEHRRLPASGGRGEGASSSRITYSPHPQPVGVRPRPDQNDLSVIRRDPTRVKQSPSDIYAMCLLPKGYGYPLWFPEPRGELSEEYRRVGVEIGDVGMITFDGRFDFLFNICRPANDPVNSQGVPPGFVHFPLRNTQVTETADMHDAGTYVSSADVVGEPGTNPGTFKFECTSSTGAMLMLPEGGIRRDLLARGLFHDYAKRNAAAWYQFATGPELGRAVENGSLYLITGCDKSPAWGVASYYHPSGGARVSCEFIGTALGDGYPRGYRWKDYSPATVRVSRQDPRRSTSARYGPSIPNILDPGPTFNQCVFVRGFRISLELRYLHKLFGPKVKIEDGINFKFGYSDEVEGGNPPSLTFTHGSSSTSYGKQNSNRGITDANEDDILLENISSMSSPYHPSVSINNYLLESVKDSKIAITHDDDWYALLDKSEIKIPEDAVLIQRISRKNIKQDGDVVYLAYDEHKESNNLDEDHMGEHSENLIEMGRSTVQQEYESEPPTLRLRLAADLDTRSASSRSKAKGRETKGHPKAKRGVVRAKSGCYTCRIRRKKCDSRPNEAGECETCVRLRIECLGFGAKRPTWLRESRNVVDLRERIKTFLAAQGMIKGHSEAGPRSGPHEYPKLRLADYSDASSASSGSPPTPTLPLSAENDRHRHHTSSMRDVDWPLATYNQPGLYSPISTTPRSVSPYGSGSSPESTYATLPAKSTSSASAHTITSSFSPLYNFFEAEFEPMIEDPLGSDISVFKMPTAYMTPKFVDELMSHYVKDVINIHYCLADPEIQRIIFDSVSQHESSEHAVKLLAYVHAKRSRRPDTPILLDYDSETQKCMIHLETLLSQKNLIAEDAMAALHVVSSILFDVCQGSWEEWLHVANTYVDDLFLRYHGPADALLNCDAKDAFVVKTAIWFDVLASVTTQKSPHFMEAIRVMFDPNRSGICDAASLTPQYSMMSPMGCENHVVWVLAETSELFVWKREHSHAGSLSLPELIHKAECLETYLTPPTMITDLPSDERACSRQLTSEIFRATARLYLHSVVSGDYPDVPEIKERVTDTLEAIQRIPTSSSGTTIARSVIRSTVFSFFICGALAEEPVQRDIIKQRLESGYNFSTIQMLLNKLWDDRPQDLTWTSTGGRSPVPWRKQLHATYVTSPGALLVPSYHKDGDLHLPVHFTSIKPENKGVKLENGGVNLKSEDEGV